VFRQGKFAIVLSSSTRRGNSPDRHLHGQKSPEDDQTRGKFLNDFVLHSRCIKEAGMKRDRIREEREVTYYILDYLSDNPDAGDTLEGILEWWLLTRSIKFEMGTVSQAVASLVAEGLIMEQKGLDSRSIYRVKQTEEDRQKISDRLKEIRRSLQD